jgi:dihydrofolate reductase
MIFPKRDKGDTAFFFVSQGIEAALQQTKKAAHNNILVVGGGSDIAQQFIRSGLLYEVQIHLVPIILDAMKTERVNAITRRFSTSMIQHQVAGRPRDVLHRGPL